MTDTIRSSTDLLTNLFQDGQAANSITAQDIRDLIVSMKQSNASFYMATPAATTIAAAGTYYKAAGTTTFEDATADLTDDSGTSNRIKYIGTPARHCEVAASVSLTCASSNDIVGFRIAKNGVTLADTTARVKLGTGTDINNISLIAHMDLALNDYIELWCTNESTTGAITVQNCHVIISGFLAP